LVENEEEKAKREAQEKAAKEVEDNKQKEKEQLSGEKKKSLLDEAKETAERIEKANAVMKENLDRQENIIAEERLGGRAEAGSTPKEKTDDEKWAEGAKERYAGTGLDPTPDDTPIVYS